MKIFYSENTVNPGYYSFGYSIYGYKEESDTLDMIYDAGFQPCVLYPNPDNLLYMNRGSRIVLPSFKKLHEHTRIEKKYKDSISITVFDRKDFPITDVFIDFCLTYFRFRHGKDSMPKERLLEIINSPFLTHIVEYQIDGEVVGYMFEVHGTDCSHFWYQAYAKKYNNKNLGLFMVLDLVLRSKNENKQYVYLGITCGTWMKYKLNFQPLQYWDGTQWIHDNQSLKKLLKVDHMRFISFTDAFRTHKDDFYKAPVQYTSMKQELRFLLILMYKTPKLFFALLVILGLLSFYFIF
jgi:hypothetical protein